MLGTGHAMTTKCFNTCFIYENEHGKMLIDTGGGQQLVGRLQAADINVHEVNHVFLSHRHTDHILGLPWLVRMRMKSSPQTPLTIYAHEELCREAELILNTLFPEQKTEFEKHVFFRPVNKGEVHTIIGRNFLFYDTQSERCKQFGFAMTLYDGNKFVFNGDIPFHESNRVVMQNAKYLMHEAFALESQMKHNPGGHSSVSQTGQFASSLGAEKLIIVHGSDQDLLNRKDAYTQEASVFFKGRIFVPYDLETIELDS